MQSYFGAAGLAYAVIVGSKQLIPHQQELTEIDLRILEVAFVMPTVCFCNADDAP
ncbi:MULTISPECIES: hypothetical protein [Pseudomonadaceae]|uniref:hypothetical protein n=1 Tax=Pseudomonadaceae TaxID=135621 RepID=UPI0008F15E11|nr:hypothetical protein [Pseudomonas otitidis]SFA63521.1 hypothetical protein SAMN05216263_112235 [Pseudomonas otitidis]